MSFKEITDLNADVTISLGGTNKKTGKPNPTQVEGYYLGTRQVDGKKGPSNIYFFQTSKGNVGLWGKTDIDNKMKSVTPGAMTRVTFDKMVPTPKGDMYKFKVAVDATNTIEVSAPSTVSHEEVWAAADDSDDTALSIDDGSDDLDQAAALAAAERQARAAAILRNAKLSVKK